MIAPSLFAEPVPMRLSFLSLALVAALSTGCVASNDDGLVDCGNANDSDCNAKVIAELRAAGSDMDATHQIEFYVYYPTRAEADAAAKQLADRNFKTSVDG